MQKTDYTNTKRKAAWTNASEAVQTGYRIFRRKPALNSNNLFPPGMAAKVFVVLRPTAPRFCGVGQSSKIKFILPQDLLRFKLYNRKLWPMPPSEANPTEKRRGFAER